MMSGTMLLVNEPCEATLAVVQVLVLLLLLVGLAPPVVVVVVVVVTAVQTDVAELLPVPRPPMPGFVTLSVPSVLGIEVLE